MGVVYTWSSSSSRLTEWSYCSIEIYINTSIKWTLSSKHLNKGLNSVQEVAVKTVNLIKPGL
jgi:hypothetical protein